MAAIDTSVRIGLIGYGEVGKILARSQIVIAAVTAANSFAVAEEAARTMRPGTWYLDLNSASPGTKARSARLIEGAGAHYVAALARAGLFHDLDDKEWREYADRLLGALRAAEAKSG